MGDEDADELFGGYKPGPDPTFKPETFCLISAVSRRGGGGNPKSSRLKGSRHKWVGWVDLGSMLVKRS